MTAKAGRLVLSTLVSPDPRRLLVTVVQEVLFSEMTGFVDDRANEVFAPFSTLTRAVGKGERRVRWRRPVQRRPPLAHDTFTVESLM